MSEPKESEAGDAPEAETEGGAQSAEPSEGAETEAEATGTEAEAADAPAAPKKKKKRAREATEPETIRDRNERVRAEAADKRRARREREQGSAPKRNLDASEMMDDALARSTHAAAGFLRSHFNKVQWLLVAGLAGWIAYEVYDWRRSQQAEKATTALFKALSAENGRVAGAEREQPEGKGELEDTRRGFASDEERLKTAKSEYLLASGVAGPASSVLAELGAAGTAYDLGQYKDAQAAYERVKQHPAYKTDSDIKGRTLEGLGMALEAQKDEPGALKSFHEMANLDSANLSALGLYHEARLLQQQGKRDEAIKKLEKAGEKLVALKETPAALAYLRLSVLKLYEALDPNKARELHMKLLPGDLLKQLQAKQPGLFPPGGAAPAPLPLPAPEAPAPEAPAPEAPAPAPEALTPAPEAPAPAAPAPKPPAPAPKAPAPKAAVPAPATPAPAAPTPAPEAPAAPAPAPAPAPAAPAPTEAP